MAKVLVVVKMLPEEVGTDLQRLRKSVESSLPEGVSVRGFVEEPIAFGLVALVANILVDEAEGDMERVESVLQGLPGVSQVEILNVTRLSF